MSPRPILALIETPMPPLPSTDFIADVLLAEADAIRALTGNPTLMIAIRNAAAAIAASPVPLIVSGVGKSGHIARKIASTFCSLGKAATFLHAAEASHGDLGIIGERAILLVLSNSGETSELSDLLAYAAQHAHPVIGLTASATSTLGALSSFPLAYGKQVEACRNGLAPTTSTAVTLAIGDALAVAVSEILQIQPEDFRRYHPGGKLGARLAKAGDVMHTGAALPIKPPSASTTEAFIEMSSKNLGALLVEENGDIVGIITDGDLRRNANNLLSLTVGEIATPNPFSVTPDTPIEQAKDLMAARKITSCLVRDRRGHFLGLLHIHDCAGPRS